MFALSSPHITPWHYPDQFNTIKSTHFRPISQISISKFSHAHPCLPTALLPFLYSVTQWCYLSMNHESLTPQYHKSSDRTTHVHERYLLRQGHTILSWREDSVSPPLRAPRNCHLWRSLVQAFLSAVFLCECCSAYVTASLWVRFVCRELFVL
jgi:hypothetical protein